MLLERLVNKISDLPRMVEIPDIFSDGSISWETEPIDYDNGDYAVLINYLVRLNGQTKKPEEILAAVGCSIDDYLSSDVVQSAVLNALERQFGGPSYLRFCNKIFADYPELKMGFPIKEESPDATWCDALSAYTFDSLQSFNDPDLDPSGPLILRLSPMKPTNLEKYLRAEANNFQD